MAKQLRRPAAAAPAVKKKPASTKTGPLVAKKGKAACPKPTRKKPAASGSQPAKKLSHSGCSNIQAMTKLLKHMPTMASDMFGPNVGSSDEEHLSVGVDTTKPGIHYFGEDGWDCGAGGSHDEVQFKVDVDFGSFCMPNLLPKTVKKTRGLKAHGLGRHGSKQRDVSAEVSAASLSDVFSILGDLTLETSASLDPRNKYRHVIPLEQMVDDLGQLCGDFAQQGAKVVSTLKSFLGIHDDRAEAVTVHIVREGGILAACFFSMAGEPVAARRNFEITDSIDKLHACVRDLFGASSVKLYNGADEADDGSQIASFDILTAKVVKDRQALFHARIQRLHVQERSGHIWGDEDPNGELEDLQMQLNYEDSPRTRKQIENRIAELEEQWKSYNDSRFESHSDVTIFVVETRAKRALARLRIAKRVHRDCCCINPFSGQVEL